MSAPSNKVRRKGSYAPLSAHYYKDERIALAGEKAELLYVRGLAFCAEVLTDGFIADVQLDRFVGVGLTNPRARAKTLADLGLWLRDDERGGYTVSAWLNWNRSSEEIGELLRRDSERKAAGK